MQLTFYGAARTVTGSKYLLTLANGTTILLDCGMFQGLGVEADELNSSFEFDPAAIHHVILSHAHIDHSGMLPKLVKEGFRGKIFCTAPTKDLAAILLEDSANIQNNGNGRKEEIDSEAFYNLDDVAATLPLFETVEYHKPITLAEGVTLELTNSGHLLGAAGVYLIISEQATEKRLFFTGDIGRYRDALLCPPQRFQQADYIIAESTYGNRLHEALFSATDHLMKIIHKTCVKRNGRLVIPAFSLGRTQEVLYLLNQLSLEKRLPDIPVFVDSPLSRAATAIYKSYKSWFNESIQRILEVDDDPFAFPGLRFIQSVEDSRKLDEYPEPCIIIAASGMADAGRVRHHIAAAITNPANGILFAGYCSPGTIGGKLTRRAQIISILGTNYRVRAKIMQMHSMSAHGDVDDICRLLSCQDAAAVKKVFLVHGDYDAQVMLREKLLRKGFEQVHIPAQQEAFPDL